MPRPEVFSERKSSSMMTMGNWKRSIGEASLRQWRKSAECRAEGAPFCTPTGTFRTRRTLHWGASTSDKMPMELSNASVWWVAAGVAVAAELGTGTFYLLMIALGLLAGALAAHLGIGEAGQFLAAAVIGGGATAAGTGAEPRAPRRGCRREETAT